MKITESYTYSYWDNAGRRRFVIYDCYELNIDQNLAQNQAGWSFQPDVKMYQNIFHKARRRQKLHEEHKLKFSVTELRIYVAISQLSTNAILDKYDFLYISFLLLSVISFFLYIIFV